MEELSVFDQSIRPHPRPRYSSAHIAHVQVPLYVSKYRGFQVAWPISVQEIGACVYVWPNETSFVLEVQAGVMCVHP